MLLARGFDLLLKGDIGGNASGIFLGSRLLSGSQKGRAVVGDMRGVDHVLRMRK